MNRTHAADVLHMSTVKDQLRDERGFTLIELLVVILIIGILAAIAIPSFLNQKGKANDASAKVQVRTAETAAETYSVDHNGKYEGMSTKALGELEPTLKETSPTKLLKAEEKEGGYLVESEAVTSKDTFSIERTSTGGIVRKCATAGKGACPTGGVW
jgi:type IV pilus assembly protein PilA